MNRIEVNSTVIGSIGYEEGSSTLEVTFLNGYVYQFYLVPKDMFSRFLEAPSKGAFFDSELRRGAYRWDRVSKGSSK